MNFKIEIRHFRSHPEIKGSEVRYKNGEPLSVQVFIVSASQKAAQEWLDKNSGDLVEPAYCPSSCTRVHQFILKDVTEIPKGARIIDIPHVPDPPPEKKTKKQVAKQPA